MMLGGGQGKTTARQPSPIPREGSPATSPLLSSWGDLGLLKRGTWGKCRSLIPTWLVALFQIQPLALTWVRPMAHFHVLPSGLAILNVSPYLETHICLHHCPQADTALAYFLQEFSNET